MKMKRFFWGAFGLLALTSCSNDELTSVNRDGDEIVFNVVTNSVSRAENVYCNNNLPGKFKVWARHANKPYIDGDVITKGGTEASPTWVNSSGTRYWPNEGEVSFFASYNEGVTEANPLTWSDDNIPSVLFTVDNTVATQKDFIYAAKKQVKPANGGQVALNFRHALSQIVFKAKNTNSHLYVEIKGVSVCNVKSSNTFTYPLNTDDNIVNHNLGETAENDAATTGSRGTWGENSSGKATYNVTFEHAVALNGKTGEVKSLTNTDETEKQYSNVMLLLPQGIIAWDANEKPSAQDNSYFLVNCRIFNIAGTSFNESTDVCLWGKKNGTEYEAKEVAIPISAITWEQGKKYIYTFVFGDGNGGYDPDPETPTPVLVPITFSVTVDDFVSAGNTDIKMETK